VPVSPTRSILTILAASAENSGKYRCEGISNGNTASKDIAITVE